MTVTRFAAAAVFAVLVALALAGCWDRIEVDDVAFITALGLDEAPDNQVYVTFQIAVPRALSGGGGPGGGGGGPSGPAAQTALLTTVMGRSVFGVEDLVHAYVDRRPSLVHGKVVVVGESLARRGIGPHVAEVVRFREARRTMFLVVAKGTARELLEKNRPVLEQNPAKALELLALTNHQTGLVPSSQLHRFLVEVQSLGEAPLVILAGPNERASRGTDSSASDGTGTASKPVDTAAQNGFPERPSRPSRTDQDYYAGAVPRVGGNPVEFLGAAVFRGDRMVGELTGDEVRAVLLLRGTFRSSTIVSRDPFTPGRYVSYDMRLARPTQITVERTGKRFRIGVKVMLEGEVVGTQSETDYSDPSKLHALEDELVRELEALCRATVRKAQVEFRADIFAFGNKARHLTRTWREWEELDWPGKFPDASVDIDVRVDLRRTGLLFRPPERAIPGVAREAGR